jgi:hypothetical protein
MCESDEPRIHIYSHLVALIRPVLYDISAFLYTKPFPQGALTVLDVRIIRSVFYLLRI